MKHSWGVQLTGTPHKVGHDVSVASSPWGRRDGVVVGLGGPEGESVDMADREANLGCTECAGGLEPIVGVHVIGRGKGRRRRHIVRVRGLDIPLGEVARVKAWVRAR
eukprot:TRINITY_DN3336_c0_g1_i12.p2 TRINITY_DN3336_c0_g1~~TRINITY_DN3336_c0_g1_i12.p2  ORF type:complete len:107 (-),score=5.74 TRINITY_DN3336_c0_g1_i12:42-362(-)